MRAITTAALWLLICQRASVLATPSCDIQITEVCELRDWTTHARIESTWTLWHASIASKHVLWQSSAAILVQDDTKFVYVPSSWYYEMSEHALNQTRAHAACGERTLTNATLVDSIDRPYISFLTLAELVGSSFMFCTHAQIVAAASELTPVFFFKNRGRGIASNCADMLGCVFDGTLRTGTTAAVPVQIVFSLMRAGIGVPIDMYTQLLPNKCATLTVYPNLQLDVCAGHTACRSNGQLCVHSVHPLDGDAVVVGVDPLLPEDMLVFHFDIYSNRTTVGIEWTGESFWQTDPVRAFFGIIVAVIAINWRPIPMANTVESLNVAHGLQLANALGAIFMVTASGYFAFTGAIEAIDRVIDSSYGIAVIVVLMLFASVLVHAAVILYAHTEMPPASTSRVSVVRIFYTAIICETIVMASCGATQYEKQAMFCVFAVVAWTFVVSREVTAAIVQHRLRVAAVAEIVIILAFLTALPSMIVSVTPSLMLLGIEHPWSYSVLVCVMCVLGGVTMGLEPKYRAAMTQLRQYA